MRLPVPRRVERRVVQPEVGGQVDDDPHRGRRARGPDAGTAVGQGEEDHVQTRPVRTPRWPSTTGPGRRRPARACAGPRPGPVLPRRWPPPPRGRGGPRTGAAAPRRRNPRLRPLRPSWHPVHGARSVLSGVPARAHRGGGAGPCKYIHTSACLCNPLTPPGAARYRHRQPLSLRPVRRSRETAGSDGPHRSTPGSPPCRRNPMTSCRPNPMMGPAHRTGPFGSDDGRALLDAVIGRLPEFVPTYLALAEACDDDPGEPAVFVELADFVSERLAVLETGRPELGPRPRSHRGPPRRGQRHRPGRRPRGPGLLRLLLAGGPPPPGAVAGPALAGHPRGPRRPAGRLTPTTSLPRTTRPGPAPDHPVRPPTTRPGSDRSPSAPSAQAGPVGGHHGVDAGRPEPARSPRR